MNADSESIAHRVVQRARDHQEELFRLATRVERTLGSQQGVDSGDLDKQCQELITEINRQDPSWQEVTQENWRKESVSFAPDVDTAEQLPDVQAPVEEESESEDCAEVMLWTDESIGVYSSRDIEGIVRHLASEILNKKSK